MWVGVMVLTGKGSKMMDECGEADKGLEICSGLSEQNGITDKGACCQVACCCCCCCVAAPAPHTLQSIMLVRECCWPLLRIKMGESY